jgi:ABC-type microcin C transport system duplicated ATPase subunit YejF
MKILIATDGSQYADEAAWLLGHLPHSDKLELTVLFISNLPVLHGVENAVEIMKHLRMVDQKRAANIFAKIKEKRLKVPTPPWNL